MLVDGVLHLSEYCMCLCVHAGVVCAGLTLTQAPSKDFQEMAHWDE